MFRSLHRIFALAALALALPAQAQLDPPARVGRLSIVENEVIFRVDRNDQGGPATINWPVSNGAVLETGRSGRAEVWIGSTAYRLADDSQIEFPVIDDRRVDVKISGGTLAVSTLDRDQVDDVAIATPEGNIRFLTPGRYRIDVLGDRTELSVQAGRAIFDGGQRATPVNAGQMVSRWNDGQEGIYGARSNDSFDHWVAQRENATLASTARRYVSPHMTGYQDLDGYGDWRSAPDYGTVWYPRGLADDWAPYRDGRWAWVAPWGWTWIDAAPWGFTPFHYGRWALIGGRWGWVPGRLVPRPVYAPALVGWVGNPGWNIRFSFGAAPAVGWFPLGPREVYVPSHRYSAGYVQQLNITHVHDVKIIDRARHERPANYAYAGQSRALTVVPANVLREGRPINAAERHRHDRGNLPQVPIARRGADADWLAPARSAVRPQERDMRRSDADHRDSGRDRRSPDNRFDSDARRRGPETMAIPPTARDAGIERRERSRREALPDPAAPTFDPGRRGESRLEPQAFGRPGAMDNERQPGMERRDASRRMPDQPLADPARRETAPNSQPPLPERGRDGFRRHIEAGAAPRPSDAPGQGTRELRDFPRADRSPPRPPEAAPTVANPPSRELRDASRPPDAPAARRDAPGFEQRSGDTTRREPAPTGQAPLPERGRDGFRRPAEPSAAPRPADAPPQGARELRDFPRAERGQPRPAEPAPMIANPPPSRELSQPRTQEAPAMRREMPAFEQRGGEPRPAPMAQPPREVREMPRQERAAPPPVMQRQEAPRPAPEFRAPPPQREAPPPRMEAPRPPPAQMQPPPPPAQQQQGNKGRRDEERGGR